MLYQKIDRDSDGYPVKCGKSHLFKIGSKKTFCGIITNPYVNLVFGTATMARWIIDKTTCKKCKKIAEKMIKE